MYDVQWDLKSYDNVIQKMRALPVALRAKPGRSALGSTARVITNAAKANAKTIDDPDTGRSIARNIVQRFRSRYFKQTGDLMISVGVATPRGRIPSGNPDQGPSGPTFHWHLVELGTEKMPARPFLRPALASSVEPAQSVFAAKLSAQIDKLVP